MRCTLASLVALLAAATSPRFQDAPQEHPWYRVEGAEIVIQPTVTEERRARGGPTLWDLVELTRRMTGIDFYIPRRADEDALKKEGFRI